MNFSDQVKALYSKNVDIEKKEDSDVKLRLVNLEAVYSVMEGLTDGIDELSTDGYSVSPELVELSKGLITIYNKTVKTLIEETVPVITIEADLKGEK